MRCCAQKRESPPDDAGEVEEACDGPDAALADPDEAPPVEAEVFLEVNLEFVVEEPIDAA